MSIKTLVINPGSTSTKVGVFEDETLLFEETLRHPTEEIAKYASVIDQKDFRKEIILDFLKEKNCDPKSLNVIVGRGGLLKPIPGGTYTVSDALLADLVKGTEIVSFQVDIGASRWRDDPELAVRPIDEADGAHGPLVLGQLKGRTLPLPAARFAEQLARRLDDMRSLPMDEAVARDNKPPAAVKDLETEDELD